MATLARVLFKLAKPVQCEGSVQVSRTYAVVARVRLI